MPSKIFLNSFQIYCYKRKFQFPIERPKFPIERLFFELKTNEVIDYQIHFNSP
jgi:hypothetical protein